MDSKFDKAIRYVMENEDGVDWDHDKGEYTNDPRDPGGRTIWGIIQSEYEAFLGRELDEADIRNMPRDTALAIYRENFWVPIHGDSYLSDAAAIAIMDTAVNKGLGGCNVILQDALGAKFASRYSLEIIQAVNSAGDRFLEAMCNATLCYIDARIAQYPNMEWARKGWQNRARRMLTLAKQ